MLSTPRISTSAADRDGRQKGRAYLLGGLLSILVSVLSCAASPSDKELLAFARRAEKLIEQHHPDQKCRVVSKGGGLEFQGSPWGSTT
jgi:hypothetical protein